MVASTEWDTRLLDEAAAIVEAEWMRLLQNQSARELEPAERPSVRRVAPPRHARAGVTTTELPPAGDPVLRDPGARRPRRRPAMTVWPTQRSPPSTRGVPRKDAGDERR
jgi:hypothetical protein